MPSKKKKYNSRFPPARIKKIMQMDEEVGKVAAAVPVIISRALELFVESLILRANGITQDRQAKTMSIAHVKRCITSDPNFGFLKEMVADIPDVPVEEDERSVQQSTKPTGGTQPICDTANSTQNRIPPTRRRDKKFPPFMPPKRLQESSLHAGLPKRGRGRPRKEKRQSPGPSSEQEVIAHQITLGEDLKL